MRLIDADAMRDDWLENGENEYVYDTNAVLASIDEQPTIDAEPVVHGRWVKSNKHIWRKTKSGEVDEFWYEYDYHNGPGCEVCGFSFCEHCDPEKWDDETCQDHYICSVLSA